MRVPLAAPAALPRCPLPPDGPEPAPVPRAGGQAAAGANRGAGRLPSLEALGAADLAPVFAALGVEPPARAASSSLSSSSSSSSSSAAAAAASAAPAAPRAGTIDDDAVLQLPPLADARGVMRFVGGEAAALARLRHYVWGAGGAGSAGAAAAPIRTYKETRNGLLGEAYSSKLSPWLSQGALSARLVLAEVRAHEAAHGANESTGWLVFELLWRDYFSFYARKLGSRLFHLHGARGASAGAEWRRDPGALAAWATGRTGWPFVDGACAPLRLRTSARTQRAPRRAALWAPHTPSAAPHPTRIRAPRPAPPQRTCASCC